MSQYIKPWHRVKLSLSKSQCSGEWLLTWIKALFLLLTPLLPVRWKWFFKSMCLAVPLVMLQWEFALWIVLCGGVLFFFLCCVFLSGGGGVWVLVWVFLCVEDSGSEFFSLLSATWVTHTGLQGICVWLVRCGMFQRCFELSVHTSLHFTSPTYVLAYEQYSLTLGWEVPCNE